MHINTKPRSLILATAVLAVAACGPSEETRRRTDSAVAAAEMAKVATQAGEVMGARREAQAFLDSARAAFVAKNAQAASKGLRDAAAFTRKQADSAAEPAKKALINSATELDRLADRVTKKSVKAVKTLDYAFARTQVAEAQLHCTRAIAAWKTDNAGATSSEIVMLTDHFERAASDAGRRLDPAAQQAVVSARSVAAKLAQGATVPRTDVDSALASMDKEVHRFMVSVAKLKS